MLPIRNTYEIAAEDDVTRASMSSLMECTDDQRLALDLMSFGNFSNDSVQTLQAGSRANVSGVLYGPAGSEVMPLYAASDTDLRDISQAPNNATYYLTLIPSPTGATYALKTCNSVSYQPDRGGYYETGTQNRVFGTCFKYGGSFPSHYKRRYFHPSAIETFLKIYSDGLEGSFRKILCQNPGIVDTPISNYEPSADDAAHGIIQTPIPIQYPCALHVWVRYASSPSWKIAAIGEAAGITSSRVSLFGDDTVIGIGLEKLHTDGTWIKYGEPVKIFGFNSTYNNKSVIIPIHGPGTYRIAPVAGYRHSDGSGNKYGNITPAATYAPGIGQISASVVSVFGSKVDY